MVKGVDIDRSRLLYRWDLDKTYLRTEFDTLRDLVRTAFESPRRKQTVPGAAALLREIRGHGPSGIHILSGSPEQMRRVLEAKLRLDGVHWDDFTLKPNLQNLLHGRLRSLRDQTGYKLAALLSSRERVDPRTDEILFGDDAESDAFIYSLYADLCAGRVGPQTLMEVLRRARVYEEDIAKLVRLADRLPERPVVQRMFIHLDRMTPPEHFEDFGRRTCPFYNYFQPAVVLVEDGAMDAEAALRVGAGIVVHHAFPPDALTASFMDLARRRYVGPTAGQRILDAAESVARHTLAPAAPVIRRFAEELAERIGELDEPAPVRWHSIDYLRLFSGERAHSGPVRSRPRR
jgi:hypothetical protein